MPTQQSPTANRRAAIRFVTTSDFPPFNYFDNEGRIAGLNVDVARTVCSELAALCDIQVRPWDDLLTALRRGEADAAIASHLPTARILADFAVSERYYHTPARFVAVRGAPSDWVMTPSGLASRRIGVVRGSAHEAYLRTFFTSSVVQPFENRELARDAVRLQQVELLFDDGVALSLWLKGDASRDCCELRGGPFVEPRYFGDGIGIVLARTDPQLKVQVDGALRRLREAGRIADLIAKYFPVSPF